MVLPEKLLNSPFDPQQGRLYYVFYVTSTCSATKSSTRSDKFPYVASRLFRNASNLMFTHLPCLYIATLLLN